MTTTLTNNIEDFFLNHLKSLGIKDISLKNYKSDLSSFTQWVVRKFKLLGIEVSKLNEILPFITKEIGVEYKNYLRSIGKSPKSTNRKLSTLRNFSKYLVSSSLLPFDFMDDVPNVRDATLSHKNPLLSDFRRYLESKNSSSNTIKSYLSDIKHFIDWAEKGN